MNPLDKLPPLPQTPTAGSCTPASHGSIEHQVLLWDAINQYAESCGGEPHTLVYGNTRRQQLVVEIMRLVYQSNTKHHRCDDQRGEHTRGGSCSP